VPRREIVEVDRPVVKPVFFEKPVYIDRMVEVERPVIYEKEGK
jgi:hypothetical protein